MDQIRRRERRWLRPFSVTIFASALGGCALTGEATPASSLPEGTVATAANTTIAETTNPSDENTENSYAKVKKVFAPTSTSTSSTIPSPPTTHQPEEIDSYSTATTILAPSVIRQISWAIGEMHPVFGIVAAPELPKEDNTTCMATFRTEKTSETTAMIQPGTIGSIRAIEKGIRVSKETVHPDTDLRQRGGDMQLQVDITQPESVESAASNIYIAYEQFCHIYDTELISPQSQGS